MNRPLNIPDDWVFADTPSDMFTHQKYLRFSPSKNRVLHFGSAPLASSKLWRGVSSGHTIELLETENITVLIPRRGWLKVETKQKKFVCKTGEVMVCAPGERVTKVYPDKSGLYACEAVLIPTSQGHTSSMVSVLDHRFEGALCFNSGDPFVSTIDRYFCFLFDDAHRRKYDLPERVSASAASTFEDLLHEAILDLDARDYDLTPPGSFADRSVVAQAEHFMREHYAEPLTMAAIAKRINMTPRRLQYAFKNVRGQSPRAVLMDLRLDEARRLLQTADSETSVMNVVLDCGFSNAGRFSKAYANRFGELPSTVLRRRR